MQFSSSVPVFRSCLSALWAIMIVKTYTNNSSTWTVIFYYALVSISSRSLSSVPTYRHIHWWFSFKIASSVVGALLPKINVTKAQLKVKMLNICHAFWIWLNFFLIEWNNCHWSFVFCLVAFLQAFHSRRKSLTSKKWEWKSAWPKVCRQSDLPSCCQCHANCHASV